MTTRPPTLWLALLLLSPVGLSGCVSSQYMALGAQTYQPRPAGYIIDVYLPTDAPVTVSQELATPLPLAQLPTKAVVVGRIDTQGAPLAGWKACFENAKEKARALGGDGIVVRRWNTPVAAVDANGSAQYGKAISMEVVRYRD